MRDLAEQADQARRQGMDKESSQLPRDLLLASCNRRSRRPHTAEAVIVPSLALTFTLPLRCALGWPEMPNCVLYVALARMLARIAESGIASMSPAPNTGVGIRINDVGISALTGSVHSLAAGSSVGWYYNQQRRCGRSQRTSHALRRRGFRQKFV